MDYFGYTGKILNIDLETGTTKVEKLPLDWCRHFIGGVGMSGRLAYDMLKPNTGPLSSENVIVIGAGPLVGTIIPGASKWTALVKEPLGGVVAPSSAGGNFGGELKTSGYDLLVITGTAKKPIFLRITNDGAMICDASDLWGQDIYATTEQLWEQYPGCSVVAIGQAGENRVKSAITLVDLLSNLGRGGLGAVMGAKNLKAIVACGSRGSVKVAQPEKLKQLVNQLLERVRKWSHLEQASHYGSMDSWDGYVHQIFQKRNWSEIWAPEELTSKYGPQVFDGLSKRKSACISCPVGCKDILEIRDGEYKGLTHYTSAYLNSILAGTRLRLNDYRQALKLANECDRYGLCYFTFSTMIDFLIHLRELGIISEVDVGGLPLSLDFQSIMTWVYSISFRQGFGDVAADGWNAITNKIGKGCDMYTHMVKGKDLLWEPRISGLGTMEFDQVVCIRGANSSTGGSPTYIPGLAPEKLGKLIERMGVSQEALERIFSGPVQPHVGRLSKYAEDFFIVMTSLGVCMRPFINRLYTVDQLAEIYSATTGIELSGEELINGGERGWNVLKALNVREGFDRKDDRVPERWFEPMKSPDGKEAFMTDYYRSKTLTREDLQAMLDGYYDERGWDVGRGIPTREKLSSLGLNYVADDLSRRGYSD